MNNLILIVDDEKEYCNIIVNYLNKRGFECDIAHNAETAKKMLLTGAYSGCFIDMVLQPTNIAFYANTELSNDGILLADEIGELGIKTRFVMISGGCYDMKIGKYLNVNKGSIDMDNVEAIATAMCEKRIAT